MLKYIGDLSAQDAELLERYARSATSILEFGVGGSTQIIAQAMPKDASFISLDTDSRWIKSTREHLRHLRVEDRCRMLSYSDWPSEADRFDLIFNDGVGRLRQDFALRSFPRLVPGGVLLFHDTRRLQAVRYVLALVETFFEEISSVKLNEDFSGVTSNITAVRKKSKEPYVNWKTTDGKPSWAYGKGTVPADFWTK